MKFFTYQRLCAIVFSYALSVLLYAGSIFYEDKATTSNSDKVELVHKQQILLEQ
ncbi:MAG: hypothetical protein ACI85I_002354 [Arenicella sp.]|jgi:hypothetical protein